MKANLCFNEVDLHIYSRQLIRWVVVHFHLLEIFINWILMWKIFGVVHLPYFLLSQFNFNRLNSMGLYCSSNLLSAIFERSLCLWLRPLKFMLYCFVGFWCLPSFVDFSTRKELFLYELYLIKISIIIISKNHSFESKLPQFRLIDLDRFYPLVSDSFWSHLLVLNYF